MPGEKRGQDPSGHLHHLRRYIDIAIRLPPKNMDSLLGFEVRPDMYVTRSRDSDAEVFPSLLASSS